MNYPYKSYYPISPMKTLIKLLSIILFPFFVGVFMPESESVITNSVFDEFNPEHLDGRFTGGFGEQTCHSCHFDYDLNQEGGSLTVDGLDDILEPGKSYDVTVIVESEQLEIGGFQMTARFEDGTQAGEFEWSGDRLIFTPSVGEEVQYLQHSREGTSPTAEREVSWNFTWQAPEHSAPVIFNIAANAGNDDDSSFGDWIYAEEIVLGFE